MENRFLRLYPRARAWLANLYLGERDLYLVRLIDPSYRFLQRVERELSRRDRSRLDSSAAGRRIKSGTRMFCPSFTWQADLHGEFVPLRQTRRLAARMVCRSLVGSIDFCSPYRQNRSSSRSAHLVTDRSAAVAVGLIIKISRRREKKRRKNSSPSVSARTGRFVALKRVNSSFYALLEKTYRSSLQFRYIARTRGMSRSLSNVQRANWIGGAHKSGKHVEPTDFALILDDLS